MALVFHRLLSVEEALERISEALGGIRPLGEERVPVLDAVGRVLASDVAAGVDSPPFDRSIMDGYAVDASDVYGASEAEPKLLKVAGRSEVGKLPEACAGDGACVEIGTGAPLPRGSNAVVMVEYTRREGERVWIYRPVVPGENVAQAGSDIMVGDVILRKGTLVTPREQAVLAALGCGEVAVYRRPKVAVFSTGDELVSPGEALGEGKVYDVNGYTITSMLRELGASATFMGILPDEYGIMREKIGHALASSDIVITSGSTSAGFGDVIYRIFDELGGPGVIVHGLKLKPGKPAVVAVSRGRLLIGLPGFPLSAMMVFSILVKPVVARMLGLRSLPREASVRAALPFRLEAGRGKRELLPVQLVEGSRGLVAYPVMAGSWAASALAVSEGFIDVPERREFLEEGEEVDVRLFSSSLRLPDLAIVGSHCPGIDLLVSLMGGYEVKVVNVGSTGGWYAVKGGGADIAGTHLLDEDTMTYNAHMVRKMGLEGECLVVRGYARKVGLAVGKGNPKRIRGFGDLLREDVRFVNRIKGSGIRTLIDMRLREISEDAWRKVRGYGYEAKTHSAVAAAVAQGRADVGVTVQAVAEHYGLDFIPIAEELFDFAVRKDRLSKGAVQSFLTILRSKRFSEELARKLPGYRTLPDTGSALGG